MTTEADGRTHAHKIVQVEVDKLTTWPGNPRRGDVDLIAESIEAHGFYQPIVVQTSTGYVIAGNHRLLAARQIKMARVPVVYADVPDETARKMVLVDNRAADKATYDNDALVDLLGELDDLYGTGFTQEEVERMLTPPEPEQDEPDTGSQMGDLEWRIVVDCDSEQMQARLLGEFEREGLTARPLIS